MRYGILKRSVAAISEKMLIQSLRELESDNIVGREVMDVVPPQVTYSLTTLGKSLKPVLRAMAEWGQKNSPIK